MIMLLFWFLSTAVREDSSAFLLLSNIQKTSRHAPFIQSHAREIMKSQPWGSPTI